MGAGSRVSAQRYHIHTYTELDGLPSNAVYGATQDSVGEMWFATRSGVVSYDGSRWLSHTLPYDAFPQSQREITTDNRGWIWTVYPGFPLRVSYFDGSSWTVLPPPEPAEFQGNVVGLEVTRGPGGSILVAVAINRSRLEIWNGRSWQALDAPGELGYIYGIEIAGHQLMIASSMGLLSLDLMKRPLQPTLVSNLPAGPVYGVALDRTGLGLWIIGQDWIGRLMNGSELSLAEGLDINLAYTDQGVATLAAPTDGVYFGDNGLIYNFHFDYGLTILSQNNGLSSQGVTGFYLDREQNIWVSSLRGISKLISRRFTCYNRQDGLLSDEVSAVVERRSGQIVLGHEIGLTIWGPEPGLIKFNIPPGINTRVIDLAEDPSGTLWVAADRMGLASLDGAGRLIWHNTETGLAGAVFAILFDEEGRQWVGTSHGLFKRQGQQFSPVPLPGIHIEKYCYVRRLIPGRDGAFYVATSHYGIFRIKDGGFHQWQDSLGTGGNSTYTIFERADGRLLVGTGGGLFKAGSTRLVKTSPPDPVIDRPIYCIVEDTRGRIWFGTDAGVVRWDGQRLDRFTAQDGLIGSETNRDAMILDSHGNIWIGTNGGVSVYNEKFDLPQLIPPVVEIVGISVDGENEPPAETLYLGSPAKVLTVSFRGFSFTDEKRLQYRTWLENFELDWRPLQPYFQREARYTNIPPGRYVFHVQAVKVDGTESITASTSDLIIRPHYTARWYFRAAEGIAGVLLVWFVFAFFSGRRYARRLKHEVHSRTRELRASQDSIKAESQRLAATLQSISDGVIAIGSDGKIVLCNPAAEKLLGRASDKILGQKLEDVLPVNPGPDPSRTGESPDPGPVELIGPVKLQLVKIVRPGGDRRSLEVSTAQIAGTQTLDSGLVLAFRDVTARFKQESEQVRVQKLESLGMLAGGLAHDFNNLLTISMGNLTLVEESGTFSDFIKQRLVKIRQASVRAQALTQQLLTFARGGEPQLKPSSLIDIIEQTVSFSLSGTNVTCDLNLPPDLWPAEVDPSQIGQAIGNIVINAFQAMPAGGIIHITGKNRGEIPGFEAGVLYVQLDIQDHGVGIPERDLPRIFDPYFTTKDKGSGLGLAVAYSVITKHKGQLAVESTFGSGTLFRIFLPACEEADITEEEALVPLKIPGGRILIMDDEPDIRELYQNTLARLEFECITTETGEQAVEAFEEAIRLGNPFTAVFLDLTVPGGIGGWEAVKILRQIDPEVPVIVASGYSSDPVLADFKRYGFSAALSKPFDLVALSRVLKTVV
jgi:PAS domain S-box-containing protein